MTLRLDQNLFGNGAERAEAMPELKETDGMRITALSINGQAIDPNPQPADAHHHAAAATRSRS